MEHSAGPGFSSADELGPSPLPCPPHASTSRPRVCNSCAPVLERYAFTFKSMVRQGSELKRTKAVNPNPRKPDFQHYRDLVRQDEWLCNNIFDALGMFCNRCAHNALGVSLKRLARLRNVKKAQFQNPMKVLKHEVEDLKLRKFVIMPNGCEL